MKFVFGLSVEFILYPNLKIEDKALISKDSLNLTLFLLRLTKTHTTHFLDFESVDSENSILPNDFQPKWAYKLQPF